MASLKNIFIVLTMLGAGFVSLNGQANYAKKKSVVDSSAKTIHIYVALCDNKYQGIVPVPKAIGNGQDPNSNLYWGCGYGIRSYFKKSAEWKLISAIKKNSLIHSVRRRIIQNLRFC